MKEYDVLDGCGKTLGHGESCCRGHLCGQCEILGNLEDYLLDHLCEKCRDIVLPFAMYTVRSK